MKKIYYILYKIIRLFTENSTKLEQYLIRKNKENLTNPFIEVARYWGNNKELKREVEIDLVVKGKNTLVVYECKWTNDLFRLSEVNNLRKSANHLHPTSLQAFSKSGYSDEAKNALDKAYILDDLFN